MIFQNGLTTEESFRLEMQAEIAEELAVFVFTELELAELAKMEANA